MTLPPRGARRIVAVCAVVSLLRGTAAPADDEIPKFEGGVELVAVDANVVDSTGQPVRDLRPKSSWSRSTEGRGGSCRRNSWSSEFVHLQGNLPWHRPKREPQRSLLEAVRRGPKGAGS